MFDIHRKEITWGGRPLVLETGRMARQADGAVLVHYGETTVIAAVVADKAPRAGIDFFPLTVNYIERTYAAGKIPGGFFKREGRPSEKETLTSRLIDRPIRPLFVKGFKHETQVTCTVLSHDLENDPDIVALIASSAALTLSGIPFLGPIGAARVGLINGEYVLNPTLEQVTESALDLVVAGTHDAVLMVESEAKELSEDTMLGAVMYGWREMQTVIEAIVDLAEECAKEPWDLPEAEGSDVDQRVEALVAGQLQVAYSEPHKQARHEQVTAARDQALALLGEQGYDAQKIGGAFKAAESRVVRNRVLETGQRIDGRGLSGVRPIVCEVGVLPRAHGSALFTRGETQALVVTTLGTGEDEQLVDQLAGSYREKFLLHYNFPPYSVGETGRTGFTGRREIGHGKLAWRALHPVMPAHGTFPYTVRVVSEIMESNGSSSMATVCGGSLAMMDAGVPLARPVAGIAMGLIKDGERFAVLTDILGDEDHLGDMDFKVAGTSEGVTSLQMDIKITGITEEIMRTALNQARDGRVHILGEMEKAIGAARSEMREHAPRIEMISIPREKIREVIGAGGKVIQGIVEQTGAKIDIGDDGTIKISSSNQSAIAGAISRIRNIVAEAIPGMIYDGKVVKVMDFGAFVNFIGNKDGLVHISELAHGRPAKVTDVVKEGDAVKVKFLGMDERGKVRLSMKIVDQQTGEDLSKKDREPEAAEGQQSA